MTDINVSINIRETGAKRAADNIDRLGGRAARAQRSVDRLRGILAAVGTGAAVAGIARLIGSYSNLDRRLSQFANSARTSTSLLNDIRNVADNTGSALTGTAEGYARLRVATEDLGFSHERVIGLTEQTNKLIQLSGAGAQEATAGMIQFSQALASGRLQGDEFRSLMENVPALMRTIAEGMGVPVGALRKLSRDGKLTTETIITALDKMADTVDERFSRLTDTPVQAFNRLTTAATVAFGRFAQSSGLLSGVTTVLDALASNMETIVPLTVSFAAGLTAVGAVLLTYKAYTIAAAIATRGFTAALMANPVGLIAVGIGVAVAAMVQWVQSVGGVSNAWEIMTNNVINLTRTVVNGVVGGYVGMVNAIVGRLSLLPKAFSVIFAEAKAEALRQIQDLVQKALASLQPLVGLLGSLGVNLPGPGEFQTGWVQAANEAKAAHAEFKAELDAVDQRSRNLSSIDYATRMGLRAPGSTGGMVGEQFSQVKDKADAVKTSVDNANNAITNFGSGGVGGGGGGRVQTELQRINDQLSQLGAPLQQAQQAYSTLQGLQKNGIITNDQYAASLERIKAAFLRAGGTMQQFQTQVTASSNSIAQSLAGVAQSAITGFADALVDLAFTGKANFKALAQSIIKQLVRIAVQALIVKPLLSFLGFSGGGGFGGGGGLMGFARGGAFAGGAQMFANGGAFTNSVVNRPTPFRFAKGGVPQLGVMGEAGPEAILPLKRGRDGKLGVAMQGGGGGGAYIGTLKVGEGMTINVDGGSGGDDGEAQAQRTAEAVQGMLKGMVADEIWKANQYGGMLRPRGTG